MFMFHLQLFCFHLANMTLRLKCPSGSKGKLRTMSLKRDFNVNRIYGSESKKELSDYIIISLWSWVEVSLIWSGLVFYPKIWTNDMSSVTVTVVDTTLYHCTLTVHGQRPIGWNRLVRLSAVFVVFTVMLRASVTCGNTRCLLFSPTLPLLPQLNYNVINFVNNNYIFHDRILSKARRKTLS